MKPILKALIFPVLFCYGNNYSQLKTNSTPNEFGQFYNNPFVCLSQKNSDNNFEAGFGNITNVGSIKGINTFYAYAFMSKQTTPLQSKNSFGFSIYNNTEGPYLYKRKIHLAFIRHQKISKKWMLSGGFLLGVYNTGIKANEVVGAISSNIFDGNTSFSIYSKNIKLGVSLNQFSNGKIQPASEIITLPPYLVFYGNYSFLFSSQSKLDIDITQKKLITNSGYILNGNTFGIGGRLLISKFLVGTNYYNNGINFIFGINNWSFNNHFIDFNISYYNSTNKLAAIHPNKLELSLIYKKK